MMSCLDFQLVCFIYVTDSSDSLQSATPSNNYYNLLEIGIAFVYVFLLPVNKALVSSL